MKKLFVIFFALISINSFSQAPNWVWAKNGNGNYYDSGHSIATDGAGNTYVIGYFQSLSIVFGSITLNNTTTDSTSEMFLTKYDASGNAIWAKCIVGSDNYQASSVTTDAIGNVYITGNFYSNTITFGTTTLTNVDLYLIKLNIVSFIVSKFSTNIKKSF